MDQKHQVHLLIKDTIKLLCKNAVSYKEKLCIEGLIGVRIDDSDVFFVHISENISYDNIKDVSSEYLQNDITSNEDNLDNYNVTTITNNIETSEEKVEKIQSIASNNDGKCNSSSEENEHLQGNSEIEIGKTIDMSNIKKEEIDEDIYISDNERDEDISFIKLEHNVSPIPIKQSHTTIARTIKSSEESSYDPEHSFQLNTKDWDYNELFKSYETKKEFTSTHTNIEQNSSTLDVSPEMDYLYSENDNSYGMWYNGNVNNLLNSHLYKRERRSPLASGKDLFVMNPDVTKDFFTKL